VTRWVNSSTIKLAAVLWSCRLFKTY